MSLRLLRTTSAFFLGLLLLFLCQSRVYGQASAGGATGGLTGFVTDPSGAGVPKASVRLTDASGASYDATTNKEGIYEFKALPAGVYTLKTAVKGFALFTKEIQIIAGQQQQVNVNLIIQIEEEKVEVTDQTTRVDVDSASNAGQVVMKGEDLAALSDDPDELQSELQALAGPSAGPNGGQMYIDGFTAGQLPPKASIREIRINQNPFSSEYDKLGYGRIEILTKPGTDQLHGQLMVMGNTAGLNSRNPFAGGGAIPSYDSEHYEGNLGGSISKRISFFTNIERRNQNDLSVVNTPFVDPTTLQITTFSGAFANPRTRTEVSQRFDFQVTPNNTLSTRYQYWRNNEQGDGVGGFGLPTLAYNALNTEHTFQMTDTQVLGPHTINETRFQYIHQERDQNPLNTIPTISIQGAFSSGGNGSGITLDRQNRYELQNITYSNVGKHAFKYGGRLRATTDDYLSNAGFNGTYVFGSRVDPTVTGCNVQPPQQPPSSCPVISGLQAYILTLQDLAATPPVAFSSNGAGPSYFSVNSSASGNAAASVTWFDGALFLQDDWRLRPNITLSTGLRYETQNDLGDHADWAPRVGIAWGLGGNGKNKSPKTVLRAGYGIFYDRFTSDLFLQEQLQNGIIQQQLLIQNPQSFSPSGPPTGALTTSQTQVVYKLNPALRTPYIMQAGATVERQLSKYANLSVTYLNSRGVHQFYTNATPPPSTLPPGTTGQIINQYQSGGIFKQNQLILNSRVQMGTRLSLWGYYTLNYANSDTAGAGYIPSTPCIANVTAGGPCGIAEDYGRASFDVRHRAFVGGSISMPWGLRASPFLVAQSGSPYNLTTGQDVYGINTFSARPTLGTCGGSGVISTPYGCLNQQIKPGDIGIPINEATGPARFTLNMRFSKTFGFGEKKETAGGRGGSRGGTFGQGPGGPRGEHGGGGMFGGNPSNNRYNLTFSVNARNVFNKVNANNPIGNLSSPSFGHSNNLVGGPFSSSTANRLIYLQSQFNF